MNYRNIHKINGNAVYLLLDYTHLHLPNSVFFVREGRKMAMCKEQWASTYVLEVDYIKSLNASTEEPVVSVPYNTQGWYDRFD